MERQKGKTELINNMENLLKRLYKAFEGEMQLTSLKKKTLDGFKFLKISVHPSTNWQLN